MFGTAKTKLMIVCDEKTEQYANYLRQLISANDDKDGEIIGTEDGTVNVSVWLENEYSDNKHTVSSNEHILFVGDNKTSRSEASSMNIVFNEHGLKYGWLGKRGILTVDDKPLSVDEYNSFFEFATKYQIELEKILKKRFAQPADNIKTSSENKNTNESERNKKIVDGFAATALAVGRFTLQPIYSVAGGVALAVSEGVDKAQTRKKVKDQQYRVLTMVFYVDALSKFLEE